jgi:hypothetical protein
MIDVTLYKNGNNERSNRLLVSLKAEEYLE